MTAVLIWEPDAPQADVLAHLYTEAGFEAQIFGGYRTFQQAASSYQAEPCLIVFALGSDPVKGLNQVQRLRKRLPLASLIVLSEHQQEKLYRAVFAAGADDFLIKPFDPQELLARSQAHLQRSGEILGAYLLTQTSDCLSLGNLSLNASSREAQIDGKVMKLSESEFKLLHLLCSHSGQYLSRAQLSRRLWQQAPPARKVDNLVLALRKKLPESIMLESRYGQGYGIRLA